MRSNPPGRGVAGAFTTKKVMDHSDELHHLPKAPFSVHARGVQLIDRGRLLDGQYIVLSAFRSLRDISGSLYTFILIQARTQPYLKFGH